MHKKQYKKNFIFWMLSALEDEKEFAKECMQDKDFRKFWPELNSQEKVLDDMKKNGFNKELNVIFAFKGAE